MANSNKFTKIFNPFWELGIDIPNELKPEALEEIKEYLLEQTLNYAGDGRSPVKNGPWKKKLSNDYLDRKDKFSSVGYANLELTGELLDSVVAETISRDKIEITVSGDDDVQGKAEGNNIGSYGGSPSEAKARRFIPLKGETYKKPILNGIKRILEKYEVDLDDGKS